MTPQCPKRHPGDEYTRESQLPSSEYTVESQLTGSEYIWESWLPCDDYRVNFLVYFEQAPEQVYKKNFLVTNSSGVKTPRCIHHRGVLPTWCIFPETISDL